MIEITYAYIKNILVIEKWYPEELLIQLTNPFLPTATIIDDGVLEINYESALRRFHELVGDDAYVEFSHDVEAVLHLVISFLWKNNPSENSFWFSIAKSICNTAKNYHLQDDGAETAEDSVQTFSNPQSNSRFPHKRKKLGGSTFN